FTLTVRAGNNASAGAGIVASQIDGLDVHLRFDPALLQVVSVTPGTALDQVIVATFDNAAGTIEVAGGELGGSVTGRFSAFTVTFRAIAAGTTTIDADAPTALAYQGATISPALASASVTAR
ncbi:MAG: cohesin domain-containing protein, partial [Chloroflexota bacterium]|nr:cohesin domain-containing protein [Chloroflexota bacterium]